MQKYLNYKYIQNSKNWVVKLDLVRNSRIDTGAIVAATADYYMNVVLGGLPL